MKNYIILGAGIAGISVAYHLKQKNISSIIYEKIIILEDFVVVLKLMILFLIMQFIYLLPKMSM